VKPLNIKSKLQPLPPKPFSFIPVWFSLLIALFFLAVNDLGLSFGELLGGLGNIFEYLSRYRSPNFTDLREYLVLMGQTLAMALWGTAIAFFMGFLLAPLAAKNLTPHPVIYRLSRELLNFMRAMPDLLLALIFVAAVGLGPLPGVMALGFHTTGFLGKFFAESMERVNPGIYEAVSATGASFLQQIMFAAWPAIIREVVGYTLYIFDRNVRMAAVLGLVGAGGIGLALQQNLRTFRYDESAALIIVMLVSIVAIDYLSAAIRSRLS
jgi:phosphonate transport system permease protein